MKNRKSDDNVLETNQNADKNNTAAISPRKRQMYLKVGFIGLLIAATLWYVLSTGSRIARQYSSLVYATMEIRLDLAMAHLRLEEFIVDNQITDIKEVWYHIDQAEWYAQAMLEGGQSDMETYIPTDDPGLRQSIVEVLENIKTFRSIAKKRFADEDKSSIDSDNQERFHAVFESLFKQADDVETALLQIMVRDTNRFRLVQSALIVICFILTGVIGMILHRFEQKQSVHLSMLKASNQQLKASEQQLKAINQQLKASEQQQKAINQQLKASEQQLKSANQQLRAGEQQLKAANQQLRASEQQLKTYNLRLLESQQKLALHVQHTPLGVIQWDLDFKITEWNKAAEKIFGFTSKEAIGRHAAGLIVPESVKEIVDKVWNDLLEQKGGGRSTNENITKDNKSIICDWYNTPLIDDNGKTIGVASLVLDITETKRLQELESRAERLEMAGTIAGQVAHDFNNLLAPMMAYPEFIRDELPRNHPTLQYLDQIERAAKKIADINQDLLAMGRRGHYNQEVLNLNTIVQQALSDMQPYPETLAFEVDLCDNLMDILGGNAQLHRMISNLLHNAKDAVRDIGQITVRTENYYVDDVSVVYGRVPKGEYVKLTISDTGCGIPDDIVQKIFDPFFTSKTTDKKRGSGLGMSVVDAVIRDHHGYIDLSTKVGEGTSFYIYFPITRKSLDSRDSDETRGGSEAILVVDDDDVQRKVATELLKKLGYNVGTVESGEKAIEFLRENSPDLVILDMVMPGGIDGAETYQRILEISPNQKAIILSGFSESNRVLKAQKLGAGAFVRKPVTGQVIATAVRAELDREEKTSGS